MSLVHAVDVIEEEEYKVVVGREGATLNGIRSCSQVLSSNHPLSFHIFQNQVQMLSSNCPTLFLIFQQASIMIREKKDIAKTVVGTSNSISVGKEGKGVESSLDNQMQYEVTYVGTAQQVQLDSQNWKCCQSEAQIYLF